MSTYAEYRRHYQFWRSEARTSKNPKECLRYALNMLRLARDVDARPDFYRTKRAGQTDWQRFNEEQSK